MTSVEQLVHDWQGKPKYSEETCPSAILSTTWPDPDSNPGRRGGNPATNCLSYDTVNMENKYSLQFDYRIYSRTNVKPG
jgi:hypothetical protein